MIAHLETGKTGFIQQRQVLRWDDPVSLGPQIDDNVVLADLEDGRFSDLAASRTIIVILSFEQLSQSLT